MLKKTNPDIKSIKMSDKLELKDTWPVLVNPYLPKNNQPDKNGNIYQNGWSMPVTSGATFQHQPNQTGIVTAETVKKKAEQKKYRSIDDPWESA